MKQQMQPSLLQADIDNQCTQYIDNNVVISMQELIKNLSFYHLELYNFGKKVFPD